MIRPEQVRRLHEAASDVEFYEGTGLTDGPRYEQAKARMAALRRTSTASEWVTARATFRGGPGPWR